MESRIVADGRPANCNAESVHILGREKDLGTVEKGKLADLVLLDADPLTDIKNTKTIASVVVGGKVLTRETLDKSLSEVEAKAGKKVPAGLVTEWRCGSTRIPLGIGEFPTNTPPEKSRPERVALGTRPPG